MCLRHLLTLFMPNKTDNRLQGSKYDKVFRENMLQTLPGIIERVLNLEINTIEELKDDIQFTKERKNQVCQPLVSLQECCSTGKERKLLSRYQVGDR